VASSRYPASSKRGVRVVTNVEAGCGGRGSVEKTSDAAADGEVVWSWRSDAGAKVVKTLSRLASDGGNQAMVTGESTYKRVPWKGTVLERVQVPSGKGRSSR
jgi:hypothetical protein